MSIISAAFNRSRTALSLLLFILIAGALAYINIPKESDPDIDIPIIYVSLHHEGISPEDAERLLVRPIEKEVRSIEGIKEMRSTAYEGGANVVLEFACFFRSSLTQVYEFCAQCSHCLSPSKKRPSKLYDGRNKKSLCS